MGLSKQGGEGNTILLTDMKAEEVKVIPMEGFPLDIILKVKVSPVELGSVEAMHVTMASTYCPVCGTWAADLAEMTKHKESMKHKRNRLFHVYQVGSDVALLSSLHFCTSPARERENAEEPPPPWP